MPGLVARLEGFDLVGAPVARDPESVRREAEGPEQGQRAGLWVRRVAVAPVGAGLRRDPAGQRAQRDAVEPGRRVGEWVEPERLAHLLEECDRVRGGIVPLGCTLDLLRRWRVSG